MTTDDLNIIFAANILSSCLLYTSVVITRDTVESYVPLARNDESIVTQFTMTTLEELGLLKIDFLGLRTLTVIDYAKRSIKKRILDFSEDMIDYEDGEVFKMLSSGKTAVSYTHLGRSRIFQ